jgi:hypothetical protein
VPEGTIILMTLKHDTALPIGTGGMGEVFAEYGA